MCGRGGHAAAGAGADGGDSDGAPVKIVLAGDSTVNNGGGWGPGFCADLTPNVDCVNLARNGRSSKSYYDEGVWKDVLAQDAGLHSDPVRA